jgi:hypothetical protein
VDSRAVSDTLCEMAGNFDVQEELGSNETIAHGVFEQLFIEGHEMDDDDKPAEGSLNAEKRKLTGVFRCWQFWAATIISPPRLPPHL